TLSLHDALPISPPAAECAVGTGASPLHRYRHSTGAAPDRDPSTASGRWYGRATSDARLGPFTTEQRYELRDQLPFLVGGPRADPQRLFERDCGRQDGSQMRLLQRREAVRDQQLEGRGTGVEQCRDLHGQQLGCRPHISSLAIVWFDTVDD